MNALFNDNENMNLNQYKEDIGLFGANYNKKKAIVLSKVKEQKLIVTHHYGKVN